MEKLLQADRLSKSYPGVQAVRGVSLNLYQGEILAIVGENGAGKTTLMKILGGVEEPDSGGIVLEGKTISFSSPQDAMDAGISMVFQELSLVAGLSIAENIFANRQPVGHLGVIRGDKLRKQTEELLLRFGLDFDPAIQVKRLGMGQQQILEILKAISTDPKVLILDEPTSSLTQAERDDLFENIRRLQAEGMTFIYITHKLDEVFAIADRVMVLRDGQHVGTKPVSEVDEEHLIAMMVGRGIQDMYGATHRTANLGEGYFEVRNFNRHGLYRNITFTLHSGEILGFAGLIGAGRSEIARGIFGLDQEVQGEVYLDGKQLLIRDPHDAIQYGIAYLTEDRKAQGLFLDMSIRENVIAPVLENYVNRIGFLEHQKIARIAERRVGEFNIIARSIDQKVLSLSGGNQQKCMFAMWMGLRPKVVIVDEPTRGVDVAARSDIYHKLREYAHAGTGIIMISSDLQELIGMCDRIIVLHKGQITGEVVREHFSEELIMSYAAGIRNGQSAIDRPMDLEE